MRAQMNTGTHVRDIIMRAFIHGFNLLNFKGWVTGPGGKIRRDTEGNVIDGHGKVLFMLRVERSRNAYLIKHASTSATPPLSENPYGVDVGVVDGGNFGVCTEPGRIVPERLGMDIGVSVGVMVGVGVGSNGVHPL